MARKFHGEVHEKMMKLFRPSYYEWQLLRNIKAPRSTIRDHLRILVKKGLIERINGVYVIRTVDRRQKTVDC